MNLIQPRQEARILARLLVLAGMLLAPVGAWTQEIVVGRTLPLSGAIAVYGKAKMEGADLAVRQANAAGGIAGRPLRVITLDDAYDPDRAIANTRELDQKHGAIAMINTIGVPVVAKLMPVLQELRIPAVGLSSGAPSVREPAQRYVIPVRAGYREEAEHIVKLLRTLGLKRVALLEQEDQFGKTVADAFRHAAEQGGALAATVRMTRDQPDTAAAIRAFRTVEPQAILIAANAIPAAQFIKDYRASSGAASLYAMSVTDASQIAKLGGDAARGTAFSQVVPLPIAGSRKVVRDYMELARRSGHQPSFYGFEGYLEVQILLEGLNAMRVPTREALVEALERPRRIDLGGFEVEYTNGSRRGSSFVELVIVGAEGRLMK
ncbi:MAG: ABC transporter substrate-binding protein [Proteobacteria bacterium]|nr:ABC transporter substrate-binding protein [Pseudomonadota bacterium]